MLDNFTTEQLHAELTKRAKEQEETIRKAAHLATVTKFKHCICSETDLTDADLKGASDALIIAFKKTLDRKNDFEQVLKSFDKNPKDKRNFEVARIILTHKEF